MFGVQVRLGDMLGHGAYGQVYAAHVTIDGHKHACAVKLLLGDTVLATKRDRLTFVTEARIVRMLEHRNIVRFYGIAAQRDPVSACVCVLNT